MTTFRPIAELCAMRKVLGYVWLKSLPPLRYEKCADGVCAEVACRCWFVLIVARQNNHESGRKKIVVVQLDVKKVFDHVDHRAAFTAMMLRGVSLFSMALVAAIWNGSCMKARWETVPPNKVRMSRGLPQAAPESPVIYTMIMELVLRDLIESWITRKLIWKLDDFALAVVLVAVSMSAAEILVSEVIAKLKEVGLSVGAQKTHWTSFPKMMDKCIMVDGLAVLWEEVLEFVGSKVCLDGNARHAIAHRSARANK